MIPFLLRYGQAAGKATQSATKRQVGCRVKVDFSFLNRGCHEAARERIGADLLLGLPQTTSKIIERPIIEDGRAT
jgi:hypothetical protein